MKYFIAICITMLALYLGNPSTHAQTPDGYNEQETIFYLEQQIASLMAPILDRIGVPDLPWWKPHADGRSAALPHRWDWNHAHDEKHKSYIVFTAIFYTDGNSKLRHSETSQPTIVKGQSWSRLFLTSNQPFDDTITVSMDLETTKSSSYSAEVSFSITNRTKVEAGSGPVSASTEVETTASSSFGLNKSSGVTTTEHWSEETGVHVGAHQSVRLVSDKQQYTQNRTIEEHAFVDFKFQIHLHRDSCGGRHGDSHRVRYLCDGESYQPLKFANLQDFVDFVKGRHPREHPNMVPFWNDINHACDHGANKKTIACQAVRNTNTIGNKDKRKVSVTRLDTRDYQNAGEIRSEAA